MAAAPAEAYSYFRDLRRFEWDRPGYGSEPEEESGTIVSGSCTVDDFLFFGPYEAIRDFQLPQISDIPDLCYLNVPEVLQEPELPTGCESVALTMALMYEGFSLDKTTIARKYLIYNLEDDNMAEGYIGDPFTDSGAGCFPPAIASTAKRFFEENERNYEAYDISGTEMETLLCYVAAGTPVIVWNTIHMEEPEFTGEYCTYEGTLYEWYRQEHCVLLTGYDLQDGTVQVHDPMDGIVTREFQEFKRLYDLTGQCAVVIKDMEQP